MYYYLEHNKSLKHKTPSAGQNMLYQCFLCKKLKKEEFSKKQFLEIVPECWLSVLFPKQTFLVVKTCCYISLKKNSHLFI